MAASPTAKTVGTWGAIAGRAYSARPTATIAAITASRGSTAATASARISASKCLRRVTWQSQGMEVCNGFEVLRAFDYQAMSEADQGITNPA